MLYAVRGFNRLLLFGLDSVLETDCLGVIMSADLFVPPQPSEGVGLSLADETAATIKGFDPGSCARAYTGPAL